MFLGSRKASIAEQLIEMMAQATLEDYPFFHKLSDVVKVVVTNHAEVQFHVRPEESALKPMKVGITRPAWNEFMSVGKPEMRKSLETRECRKICYYDPMNMVVKSALLSNGAMMVNFLSFTSKGKTISERCVYLSESEYEELDKVSFEITTTLMELVPHAKKSILQVHRWVLIPKEGFDGPIPQCGTYYFTKEHARRRGMVVAMMNNVQLQATDTETDWIENPDAFRFVKLVYSTVLWRACEWLCYFACPGCQNQLEIMDEAHSTSPNGCQSDERDKVRDFIDMALNVVTDDFIKRVFFHCWKELELSIVQVDKLLKEVQTAFDMPSCTRLLSVQLKKLQEDADIAEVYLVDDTLELLKFQDFLGKAAAAYVLNSDAKSAKKTATKRSHGGTAKTGEPDKKKRRKATAKSKSNDQAKPPSRDVDECDCMQGPDFGADNEKKEVLV